MKIQVAFDNINFITLPIDKDIQEVVNSTELEKKRTRNNNLYIYRNSLTSTSYILNYEVSESQYNLIKTYDINNCNTLIFIKLYDNADILLKTCKASLIIDERTVIEVDPHTSIDNPAEKYFVFSLIIDTE